MKKTLSILLLLLPVVVIGQGTTQILPPTSGGGQTIYVDNAISGGGQTIRVGGRPGVVFTSQYQTIYDSMELKPPTNIAIYQNELVETLVNAGIWGKLDIFYMFAQATNTNGEALINWISPGTYDATLAFGSGGSVPAFTALSGFQGNITNKSYIRTNYNPFSDGVNYTEQSHHAGIGIYTNSTVDGYDYGMWSNSTRSQGILCNISIAGTLGYFYDYGQFKGAARTTTVGNWYQSRLNNNLSIYQNKVKTSHNAPTTNTIASGEIYLLCGNRVGVGPGDYSNKKIAWFSTGGNLTMQEIAIKTDAIDYYLYRIGSSIYPYAPNNDVLLSTSSTSVYIDIAKHIGSAPSLIDWGDSTNAAVQDSGSSSIRLSHTYSTPGTRIIKITSANSIHTIRFDYDGNGNGNIGGDIAQITKCRNLKELRVGVNETDLVGSITNMSPALQRLYVLTTGKINGSISHLTNLTHLFVNDALSGNVSLATKMINITTGNDTSIRITADITNMMKLQVVDSYAPNSFMSGDITNHVDMVQICCGATPNEFYGDISTCPNWAYLDNYGNSHMHGDISLLNKLYRFRSYNCANSFTGSISALPLLQEFSIMNDSSNITRPSSISANPRLSYFQHSKWSFTTAEVNQILADKWSDRDNSGIGSNAITSRYINLSTANSQAPTGQGLIDKAALENYRSPNNNAAYSKWTILTR